MIPISIKKFADLTVKNNPGTNKAELLIALKGTLARKGCFHTECQCPGRNAGGCWRDPLERPFLCCALFYSSDGMLIRKLQLQDVYSVENGGYDEPFLQYRSSEGIQREALEDYLDAKKKVYLLEYNIHGMEDEQMKAVARKLFLEQEQQKCAEITVNGHIIPQRTVCRENQRAITYLAWCIEGYASWEAEMLFS